VLTTVAGWLACFVAGVVLQRRLRDPDRWSHLLFQLVLWVFSPLAVLYAYTTIEVRLELLAAFACVIAASWLMLLAGMVWGRFGGRDRAEAGALACATPLANTAILGYPLAILAFGGPGLALAVVYTEFQFLIPTLGVVLGLARHYAGPGSRGGAAPGLRQLFRSWLLNPPVVVGAVAVALRLLGVDLTALVAPVGPVVGLVVGFVGFVQLGLAISLEPLRHTRGDVWRTAVTVVLRCCLAPLVLFGVGRLTGIAVPGVLLMLSAMPVSFFSLIVSTVFDLDRELSRLLVAVSTVAAIAGVVVWQVAFA